MRDVSIPEINEATLAGYFERLDPLVRPGTELFVFGGAAIVLLGARIRTTIDIDVAAPYSRIDMENFREASEKAGLPVNPPPGYQGAYIEIVGQRMLALPVPRDGEATILFRGMNLVVKTSSDSDLAASKLVRYDSTDRSDVEYLAGLGRVTVQSVRDSVQRMGAGLRDDVLVAENMANLESDLAMWRAAK